MFDKYEGESGVPYGIWKYNGKQHNLSMSFSVHVIYKSAVAFHLNLLLVDFLK